MNIEELPQYVHTLIQYGGPTERPLAKLEPKEFSTSLELIPIIVASVINVSVCSLSHLDSYTKRLWQWIRWIFSTVARIEYLDSIEEARQLAIFDLFDFAAKWGILESVIDSLLAHKLQPVVYECIRYAKVQRDPVKLFGHRFDPTVYPENTEQACLYALNNLQVNGMEVDVVLTADGHLLCTHDRIEPSFNSCEGIYSWIRSVGGETILYADKAFMATTIFTSKNNQPSEHMPLTELRKSRSLVRMDSWETLDHEIPTLDRILEVLVKSQKSVELWIDLKLPVNKEMCERAAASLANSVIDNKCNPHYIIIGNGDPVIVAHVRSYLEKFFPSLHFRYSLNDYMIGPWCKSEDHKYVMDNLTQIDDKVNTVMDLGRVIFGPNDEFLEAARIGAAQIYLHQEKYNHKLEFCLWTINDELTFRKSLGLLRGHTGVHIVITDVIELMRNVMKKTGIIKL